MSGEMRAWVRYAYGPVDRLRLVGMPLDGPGAGEALIRVRAASLNRSDWESLVGTPAYVRISGVLRPRHPRVGSDVAGVVEAVGPGHERFAVGDEVFGDIMARPGAFGEYVCVKGALLVRKPAGLPFEEAAALPQAAVIALQAMRGRARPGVRVLLNGAGGSTGGFAIQFAKRAGAWVTAVDSAAKAGFMSGLGADEVLDFARTDFTRTGERWDLIVDVLGAHGLRGYARALAPSGQALIVGGPARRLLAAGLFGRVFSHGRRVGVMVVKPNAADLEEVGRMAAEGTLRVPIDGVYALEELPAAMRALGEGRVLGKAVVRV